jgi:HSP20 family protein
MVEDSKDSDKGKKEQDEERIERLEKRIAELEKASRKEEKEIRMEGLVENVVGQFIPGLGGIIKALEDSSPEFRQKIADTDAEIKHRIDVGWSSKPVVDYHVSTRPLSVGRARRLPEQRACACRLQDPIGPLSWTCWKERTE